MALPPRTGLDVQQTWSTFLTWLKALWDHIATLPHANTARGAWATGQSYAVNDYMVEAGATYVCMLTHTSGVFATDLAAGNWALFDNTALRADLIDGTNPAVGSGQVAYNDALTYPVGTIGGFVKTSIPGSVQAAQAAQTAAEAARDSVNTTNKVFTHAEGTTAGLAATTNGQQFAVLSIDNMSWKIYRRVDASTALAVGPGNYTKTYIDLFVEASAIPGGYEAAFADANGDCALAIKDDGVVEIPKVAVASGTLDSVSLTAVTLEDIFIENEDIYDTDIVFTDNYGNIALRLTKNGQIILPWADLHGGWRTVEIGSDDSIIHIGDSFCEGIYGLKDKAYISQLSALSPYRHTNFGIAGNDALDMQYRIVNKTAYADGRTFTDFKAKYAFIATHANDAQFLAADLSYYRENICRLVEVVRGAGVEPIISTEFAPNLAVYMLLRSVADQYGLGFVDCMASNAQIGELDVGPFHQGHPGTRTCGVFWLPMLDYIDKMPRPSSSIKIYRHRVGHTAATIADLLYKGRIDRNSKWKELTVSHRRLSDATLKYYEELDGANVNTNVQELDEYRRLELGQEVSFADYALVKIVLPGTAVTLDAVELTLVTSSAPTVYALNLLDTATAPLGRVQGATPAGADYLAKWSLARGAWRTLGTYTAPIVIPKADLEKSMSGDTLILLVEKSGGFILNGVKARYQGAGGKADLRDKTYPTLRDTELLTNQVCGTSGQLALWTVSGSPTTLVPIDVANAPRNAAGTAAVDGVCTITATKIIGQTVTVPDSPGAKRRYKLIVWARYFPKAFLNNATYALDAAQVIDRIAFPSDAPITTDTSDLRTLKCEIWAGSGAYGGAGGAELTDFAPLFWRAVEFCLEVPPLMGNVFSFRLSCPDGEIQIAKCSIREVI